MGNCCTNESEGDQAMRGRPTTMKGAYSSEEHHPNHIVRPQHPGYGNKPELMSYTPNTLTPTSNGMPTPMQFPQGFSPAIPQYAQNAGKQPVMTYMPPGNNAPDPKEAQPVPQLNALSKDAEKASKDLPPFNYNDTVSVQSNCPEMGPYRFKDGCTYRGQFLGGKRHGRGRQVWKDGSIYEGYWLSDRCHGYGRVIHADGEYYIGSWLENKADGKGEMGAKDGSSYVGYFRADKKDGKGIEKVSDGSVYDGDFTKGLRHGEGRLVFATGQVYAGDFISGKIQGVGKMTWKDGRSYIGDFRDNKMHGRGEFSWPDGKKYIGNYQLDKKHGEGIMQWSDGSKYQGPFYQGKQHGEGIYTDNKGNCTRAYWENGNITQVIQEQFAKAS